jgi:PTS system ascorbate-specific IIA component
VSIFNLIGPDGIVISGAQQLSVEEALDTCCEKLIANNKVTPGYCQAIKRTHSEIGPYYVLAPKIAMPHARPEDGVNDAALQVTVFKNGIDFGSEENGDVYLAITLAAKDSESHIQTIMALSELFQNDEDVEAIIKAESIDSVADILKKY